MPILDGIKNFLTFINNNWTTITVIISLLIALYKKVMVYLQQSQEKKIKIAKTQLSQTILKFITDAEVDYENWNKAGSVKRSQVIQRIYTEYPILSKVVDQEALIIWIDDLINNALKELRKIVAENAAT